MPTGYTLTDRPKDLSATAILLHRLRHPLRIRRVKQHDLLSASHNSSARGVPDTRHPRIEDEWLEAPSCSGSPYQLVQIEDKGEYSEQRYGNVNTYWNSIMVEAGEEEKARRREIEERKRTRAGRLFEDSEQLREAYMTQQRTPRGTRMAGPTTMSKLTDVLSIRPSTKSIINVDNKHPSIEPTRTHCETNSDKYITLTENTSVADLHSEHNSELALKWNTALTRILASSRVDPDIAAAIRARGCGENLSTADDEVDMSEVDMVPNFSYPIASARWSDRRGHQHSAVESVHDYEHTNGEAQENGQGQHPTGRGISTNGDSTYDNSRRCSDSPPDSLYCPPTPPIGRTPDSYSILCDILDPAELELYREIIKHDPRFTVLLDRANISSRQVPLVWKLHFVITVLVDRLADLEGHTVPKLRHTLEQTVQDSDSLQAVCLENEKNSKKLRKVADFGNRVLEGCWKRECSLLSMLLDIKLRRDDQPNNLIGQSTSSTESFTGSNTTASTDISLRREELGALIGVAAQNVRILREDMGDVIELVNGCKE
jgi:hypothetical protein